MHSTLKQLIESVVSKELEVLKEDSYTEADVPKVFWMVTSVDKYSMESVEQLATGELKGVKGISGSKEIVIQWLGVARNAVLVIPAKEFLEMNNVSRVMYDNPHYLVSKGMAALFRLFNRSPKNDYDWSGIMQTVMDYVLAMSKKMKPPNKHMATILYQIDYGTFSPSWYGTAHKDQKPSINTLKDLARWIRNTTVQMAHERKDAGYYLENAEALTDADWAPYIEEAIRAIGQTYKDEGEWLVKDDAMSVPKNSTLFIALDADPKKISDQAREEYAKDPDPDSREFTWSPPKVKTEKQALATMDLAKSHGLDNHYRLKFISMKKFQEYKQKFWAKREAEDRQQ